jgi:hypothetical protein
MTPEQLKEMLKEHLSVEVTEEGNMCADWLEVRVLFDDEVIATGKGPHKGFDEQPH